MIDARALIAEIKTRDETRCEATSTSLESRKKEVWKLAKLQINNKDIEKILIQLVGAVMKV